MTDCDCQACEDLERLSIVIDKLRELHHPVLVKDFDQFYVCDYCSSSWPCREARIMDGDFS